MREEFEEKVALVTGGSSGIGRATALTFAREGARVVIADVVDAGGEETVRMIKDLGGDAHFVRADVSKSADARLMVEETIDRFAALDVAVNNAGIEGKLAATADYPEKAWNRVIDVDLKGVWLSMRYEIPEMLKGGGGSIVNVSCVLGVVGFAQAPAYTAAKHGVIGLTKVAAVEYAAQGVRVNAVCPGFVETPMVMERGMAAGSDPEVHREIVGLHPIGRLGRPEEIAEVILWLSSGAASFVTGHALMADGAYTAR